MNLNNHFTELQKQLKAGHPYWLNKFPRHYITNQPFSAINAFLLGTNPANQQCNYWIDDLSLKNLDLNTANEQPQICLNFLTQNKNTIITTFPLYNAANLTDLYNFYLNNSSPTPYEILNTFQIPYLTNSNEYNVTYDPLKKSLTIPEYVKDLNPYLFFKALAQYLFYQNNFELINNDSQLIITLITAKLLTFFNYSIKTPEPNQYLYNYLINKNLSERTEQYNFFKLLNHADLLFNNLIYKNSNYLEKFIVFEGINSILPLKTKQELYRGIHASGLEQKKYLNIIKLLKKSFNNMQNNTDPKNFFFKYTQSSSNGEFLTFYLNQINNEFYNGMIIINNKDQLNDAVLQKAELDDFELDLSFFSAL